MAKARVTRKWLKDSYRCIVCGDVQYLLYWKSAQFYTCGVYGWNFDAYLVDHKGRTVCITTGYRGMIENCRSNNSYSLQRKYNELAREVVYDRELSYEQQREKLDGLLEDFLAEVFTDE